MSSQNYNGQVYGLYIENENVFKEYLDKHDQDMYELYDDLLDLVSFLSMKPLKRLRLKALSTIQRLTMKINQPKMFISCHWATGQLC